MNSDALRLNHPGAVLKGNSACPLCGERSSQIIANKDGKTNEPLMTVSCSQCGLGRIDPLPSDQALADWYAKQYRQAYKSAVQPALRHVLRAGRNALWRWQWLRQNSTGLEPDKNSQPKRSLDIGSSSGEFVYLLHRLGFKAKGIEPHEGYATYARNLLGIDINNGTLQHCLSSEQPSSLDLVSMFHVLEHLPEPVAALRSIGEKLKPDGLLHAFVFATLHVFQSAHLVLHRSYFAEFAGDFRLQDRLTQPRNLRQLKCGGAVCQCAKYIFDG